MSEFRYTVEEAKKIVADRGLIARQSAMGPVLVVYCGEEENPGSWMECDRLHIGRDQRVSSTALQLVFGD